MKINKLLIGLLCLMSIVLGSCKDDEYTMADKLTSAQVYFPDYTSGSYEVLMNEKSQLDTLLIPISRLKTDDALTVKLVGTGFDGDTLVAPTSVTFKQGEATAHVPVLYNSAKLGYDNPKSVILSIAEDAYTTPYGYSYGAFTIVCPAPWETVKGGNATYIESYISAFWDADNLSYEVELQENKLTPGFYRLVYPYDGKYAYNEEGDYDTSKTYYLEIHAENPDKVYIIPQETGMNWGYGMISVGTLAGEYIAKGDEASAEEYYGTLKDGVLTFPAGTIVIGMTEYEGGELCKNTNYNGSPILLFPGTVLADYSISIYHQGIFTDNNGVAYASELVDLGADVKSAKAVVVSASADPEVVADEMADGLIESVDLEALECKVPIGDNTGDLMVVAATIDGTTVKEYTSAKFQYYGGGASPWKSLGMGQYTEDFITYISQTDPVTYEVEIQENTENPGYYRLVNPYGAAFPLNEEGDYDPNTPTYIEIDATDPDAVLIPSQNTGLLWSTSDFYIQSYGAYLFYTQGADWDTLKSKGYFGTLKNGIITLPTFTYEDEGETYSYQGIVQFGSSLYDGGGRGAFKVVLPEAVTTEAKHAAKSASSTGHHTMSGKKFNTFRAAKQFMRIPKKLSK